MPAANSWTVDQHLARLTSPTLAAEVDLRRPDAGLHSLAFAGTSLDAQARMLAVGANEAGGWELSGPESYARGADLVATYPQTAARPYRLQVYWRVVDLSTIASLRGAACVELQLSINTSLLDTAPAVETTDDFGPGEIARILPSPLAGEGPGVRGSEFSEGLMENCATILRPQNATCSYVRLVHPVDCGRTAPDAAASTKLPLQLTLFGRYLEKGVIMRARVRGAIVPRKHDETSAAEIFQDFLHSPLPLTT
ncbi:MAG: hypothetical protein JNK76_09395 [Planctomycetales bacterium]|nr:hypothetical protein [Planctomycetales bacterium]MBN8624198.1 hypothetical protein [Planctomycetota bacterium]